MTRVCPDSSGGETRQNWSRKRFEKYFDSERETRSMFRENQKPESSEQVSIFALTSFRCIPFLHPNIQYLLAYLGFCSHRVNVAATCHRQHINICWLFGGNLGTLAPAWAVCRACGHEVVIKLYVVLGKGVNAELKGWLSAIIKQLTILNSSIVEIHHRFVKTDQHNLHYPINVNQESQNSVARRPAS